MEDLHLTTIVDETDNLVKISLSPYHNRAQEIDDYCTDHLNGHIALGKMFISLQIICILRL